MQAGTSKAGKAFASQHAEGIFVAGHSPAVVAKNIADIRQQASEKFGRDPQSVKFLALICPIIGRTEEEAANKFEDLQQYGDIDGALALFGGWTGIDLSQYEDDQELRHVESNAIRSAVEGWSKSSPSVKKWTKHTVAKHITVGGLGATVVGTPAQVADEFERWIDEADVDGFNIVSFLWIKETPLANILVKAYALKPGTFVDVIELLLPELRKRGLFHDDYAVDGGTYRENIYETAGQKVPRKDHAAYRYQWRAGVAKEDHKIPQEQHNEGVSSSNGNGTVKKPSRKRAAEAEPETNGEQTVRRKSARTSA
jgi:hypothetical protein